MENLMTVEDQPKKENKELLRHIELNDFFYGVEAEGKFYLGFGKHRLNAEPFESEQQLREEAEKINWEKIIQVAGIMAEDMAADAIQKLNAHKNQNQ